MNASGRVAPAALGDGADGGPESAAPRRTRHVVVVGAGGNIGSHLVPHLGRMPDLARVTLIDRGSYEAGNLTGQDIVRGEVGRPKAVVMAGRLRRIAPALVVDARVEAVEDVPLGRLRADAIVAALDSRVARQSVNHAAWRLGVPWIDTGVAGEGLLARVNVYLPRAGGPCLECAWDEREYRDLLFTAPCVADAEPPATRAPSSLGALSAALGALELRKLLDGDHERAAIDRQVTIDALHHRLVVTRFERRASCRRAAHDPWTLDSRGVSRRTPLSGLITKGSAHAATSLAVEGLHFRSRAVCTRCGADRAGLAVHLASRGIGRCRRCGGTLVVGGFDLVERVPLGDLDRRTLARTLASLGIRAGDVIRIEGAHEMRRHEVVE